MRTIATRSSNLGVATLVASLAYALVDSVALAHEGHAHDQSGSSMVSNVIDIASAAAALVILYVLATWFFRARDAATANKSGQPVETSSPISTPDRPIF